MKKIFATLALVIPCFAFAQGTGDSTQLGSINIIPQQSRVGSTVEAVWAYGYAFGNGFLYARATCPANKKIIGGGGWCYNNEWDIAYGRGKLILTGTGPSGWGQSWDSICMTEPFTTSWVTGYAGAVAYCQ